jgi:hypothetical protein
MLKLSTASLQGDRADKERGGSKRRTSAQQLTHKRSGHALIDQIAFTQRIGQEHIRKRQ